MHPLLHPQSSFDANSSPDSSYNQAASRQDEILAELYEEGEPLRQKIASILRFIGIGK